MNTGSPKHQIQAFTKMELLVVLVILAVLAVLLIPAFGKAKQRARQIQCINNLKALSTGFRLANLGGNPYPFTILSEADWHIPGITPFAANDPAEIWKIFQYPIQESKLADWSTRNLICPADTTRIAAGSFGTNGLDSEFSHPGQRRNALSYFVSLDNNEASPATIHLGDRYLTTSPASASQQETQFLFGQQDLGNSSSIRFSLRWIPGGHGDGGNAEFMDGSVRHLTTSDLRQAIQNQSVRTNRIWLPNSDATGRGNP